MAQDAAERPILLVLASSEAVPVIDPRAPPSNRAVPGAELVANSHVLRKKLASPAVMIAGDHKDIDAGVAEISEGCQRSEVVTRDDGSPLEPEIEKIAVDDE